jgi:hypothetical protein
MFEKFLTGLKKVFSSNDTEKSTTSDKTIKNSYTETELKKMTKNKLLEVADKEMNQKLNARLKKDELISEILKIQK